MIGNVLLHINYLQHILRVRIFQHFFFGEGKKKLETGRDAGNISCPLEKNLLNAVSMVVGNSYNKNGQLPAHFWQGCYVMAGWRHYKETYISGSPAIPR